MNTKALKKKANTNRLFLISNFGRVLNVVCFLLGNSPASEFYMPTFRNTLFNRHRQVGTVAYPGIFFGRGGFQQIQLRTEDRENGDLGAVAS